VTSIKCDVCGFEASTFSEYLDHYKTGGHTEWSTEEGFDKRTVLVNKVKVDESGAVTLSYTYASL